MPRQPRTSSRSLPRIVDRLFSYAGYLPPALSGTCAPESYLTAETLHEIERIKLHRRSLAKPRSVAVASFA